MGEREPGIDFFAQSAALIESVCELQRNFSEEFFDRLRHDDNKNAPVEAAAECCRNLFNGVANNPSKMVRRQIEYWQRQLQLCNNLMRRALGEAVEPVAQPQPHDRRFDDIEWRENALFDFIKQSYLLTAENALQTIAELDGLETRDRNRLNYFMRQLINALAPTNFVLTNPDVLRTTVATQGKNLVDGLRMMADDQRRSAEILNICMSKPDAFKLGVNIAYTPGAVVAENELMQLIQYSPSTSRAQTLPILIVPSWVNKYYVLDLTEQNSFIRWLVAQGYTVFAISWVNPDTRHRAVTFSDYLRQGPLFAAGAIERITGMRHIGGIGYCLGGILLACALAYGERIGEKRFACATYLTASIDFSDPGAMGILVDEHLVDSIERQMHRRGYLDGRLLAAGFNLLKENDLYWNYYVSNYLKGERPTAFDVLHWSSDNTNVPEATHRFVMRELHLQNLLMKSHEIIIDGHTIDLRDIAAPTYVLATDKDHIAHWQSCYAAARLQRGPVRFVLAGAGHIAGVINPPGANKYYYFADRDDHSKQFDVDKKRDPKEWLQHARRIEGSWWPDWERWQRALSGPARAAHEIDPANIIEPAPGRYARKRLDVIDDSITAVTERNVA